MAQVALSLLAIRKGSAHLSERSGLASGAYRGGATTTADGARNLTVRGAGKFGVGTHRAGISARPFIERSVAHRPA